MCQGFSGHYNVDGVVAAILYGAETRLPEPKFIGNEDATLNIHIFRQSKSIITRRHQYKYRGS